MKTALTYPFYFALMVATAKAGETGCPAYPRQARVEAAVRLANERALAAFGTRKNDARAFEAPSSNNFIDDYIFGKMQQDGVEAAPQAGDLELLRRLSLDLTGRIPAPETVQAFLADPSSGKIDASIEPLLASDAFVDYWTLYFSKLFLVTSNYYDFIGIPGRSLFYNYLQDAVARDRPYDGLVRELITAAGDSHSTAAPNFILRSQQYNQPQQDTFDELTNTVTSTFLGVQSQCISCHDGRAHLESINNWLSTRTRVQFWQQAAYFSRLNVFTVPVDATNYQRKGILTDRSTGGYNSVLSDPNNPGPRPPRYGGPYSAVSLFSGEKPLTGAWRTELAAQVTSNPQFARTAVNYLWAHFFRMGIVDPPNGWDLGRQDASHLPAGFTLQPSHPELLQALADEFSRSGFSVRHMIRLMVASRAYRLSSRYPGVWQPEYARYFAKSAPRRLSAEELYDAMSSAALAVTPFNVEGIKKTLFYAGQLPDPTEPRNNPDVWYTLQQFGQGDWVNTLPSTKSGVVPVLYFMNDPRVNYLSFGNTWLNGSTRIARLIASNLSDEEAIGQLAMATLGRPATALEIAAAKAEKTTLFRRDWLADVQWAMFNQVEFGFSH